MKTEIPIAIFPSRQSALDQIQSLDAAIYYLAHGEYSRPHYTARKIRGENDFYIHVKRYFYAGTFYAIPSGALSAEDINF